MWYKVDDSYNFFNKCNPLSVGSRQFLFRNVGLCEFGSGKVLNYFTAVTMFSQLPSSMRKLETPHGTYMSLDRALYDYVFRDDKSIPLEPILQQNANPNFQVGRMQHSCLHGYAGVGDTSTTSSQILLKYNADPNLRDAGGKTPGHIACQKGSIEFIRLLLQNGWDINIQVC
jgi:hypothetical protein